MSLTFPRSHQGHYYEHCLTEERTSSERRVRHLAALRSYGRRRPNASRSLTSPSPYPSNQNWPCPVHTRMTESCWPRAVCPGDVRWDRSGGLSLAVTAHLCLPGVRGPWWPPCPSAPEGLRGNRPWVRPRLLVLGHPPCMSPDPGIETQPHTCSCR